MRMISETFTANTSLDLHQYKFMVGSSDTSVDRAASAGERVMGVLQNKPQNAEHATIVMIGHTKCFAGGTIVAFDPITTTASATATGATSGDYVAGTAVTGVASGGIFEAVLGNVARLG